jgi:hypothetical protein
MLNTTNQSINLPDALIEKYFGQNVVRENQSELSIKIYRTNSENKFGWDKNQQNEIK